jgi:hypothetical protein
MKFYTLNSEFAFGKFKGKTVKEVLELQPTYLEWFAINLDHFYITDEAITELKESQPDFNFTDEARQKLADKHSTWANEQEDVDSYVHVTRESYGQYTGSYAQDVEGLSDDFINDVLGGEPDAYWNID